MKAFVSGIEILVSGMPAVPFYAECGTAGMPLPSVFAPRAVGLSKMSLIRLERYFKNLFELS